MVEPDLPAPAGSRVGSGDAQLVAQESVKLLTQVIANAQRTQTRIAMSFTAYLVMLVVLFAVGIGSFVVAAIRSARVDTATDVAVTAVFGGLSAAAFVTAFLSRPLRLMSSAGPEAAWLQTIVSTYWAKFAYDSNAHTVAANLDEAQTRFNRDMREYFCRVAVIDGPADPAGPTGPPPVTHA